MVFSLLVLHTARREALTQAGGVATCRGASFTHLLGHRTGERSAAAGVEEQNRRFLGVAQGPASSKVRVFGQAETLFEGRAPI